MKSKIRNFVVSALIICLFAANINWVSATEQSGAADTSVSQNDSIFQEGNLTENTTEETITSEEEQNQEEESTSEEQPASEDGSEISVSQNDIPEEPFYQELIYTDDNVVITVSAEEEVAIPENATLRVVPILPDEAETRDQYAEVEQQLQEKAEGEEYEIAGFLAYDISFVDKDGIKAEPNGAVKVSIEYINATIPQEVAEKVENEEVSLDVTVMHLEEDETGEVQEVVDMIEATDDATANKVEALVVNDNQEVEKAEFVTESFSVFTVTWTNYWTNADGTTENRVLNIHVVDIYGMEIGELAIAEERLEKGADITADTVETAFANTGVDIAGINLDTNSKKLYVVEYGIASEVTAVTINVQDTNNEGWRCEQDGWRDWDPATGEAENDVTIGSEIGATRDLYLVYDYIYKQTLNINVVDTNGNTLVDSAAIDMGLGYSRTDEQLAEILPRAIEDFENIITGYTYYSTAVNEYTNFRDSAAGATVLNEISCTAESKWSYNGLDGTDAAPAIYMVYVADEAPADVYIVKDGVAELAGQVKLANEAGNNKDAQFFIDGLDADKLPNANYTFLGMQLGEYTPNTTEEFVTSLNYSPEINNRGGDGVTRGYLWHWNDTTGWYDLDVTPGENPKVYLIYELTAVDVHVIDTAGNPIAGFEQPIPVPVVQGADKVVADFVTAVEDEGYSIPEGYTLIGMYRDSYESNPEGTRKRITTVSYNPATQAYGPDYPWHYWGYVDDADNMDWRVWYEEGQNVAVADPQIYLVYEYTADAPLTTVDTLNNDDYGIIMRMMDFSVPAHEISLDEEGSMMGGATYNGAIMYDIVKNQLENGYPVTNGKAEGADGASMAALFDTTTIEGTAIKYNDVDNLFRQDVYETTGYFRYSGFDNYAYLDMNPVVSDDTAESGELRFRVYEQIGTPSDDPRYFYQRGNFMPFNDISATGIANNRNWYDGDGNEISADAFIVDENGNRIPNPNYNTRSNERLHITQGENNYYFGMYLEANFYQPENGMVTTNGIPEEMRYSFTGDDDLWIFVDDILVLDIGGNHDSHSGDVNFATGIVTWYDCLTGQEPVMYQTSIYQMFVEALGADADQYFDMENSLGTVVKTDPATGESVDVPVYRFKNYSNHNLKMFYMERGASASNLEMEFNLATITDELVEIEKTLQSNQIEGDFYNSYYDSLEYLFMIGIRDKDSSEAYDYSVLQEAVIKGTNTTIAPDENNVFKIKSGQVAQFTVNGSQEYQIKEIGIDPSVYTGIDSEIEFVTNDNGQSYESEALAHIDFVKITNEVNTGDLALTKEMNRLEDYSDTEFKFKVWIKKADGTYEPYKGDYYTSDSITQESDVAVVQAVTNDYEANNETRGARYDASSNQVTFWINNQDPQYENIGHMWYREYGSYESAANAHISNGGNITVGVNSVGMVTSDDGTERSLTVNVNAATKAIVYYFHSISAHRNEYEHVVVIDSDSSDDGESGDAGSSNATTTEDGVIVLKAGETVTLSGLPNKTEYFIQEVELDTDMYADPVYSDSITLEETTEDQPSGIGSAGVIETGATATVTVTNALKTSVSVEKTWLGGNHGVAELYMGLYIQNGEELSIVSDVEPIVLKGDSDATLDWKGTFDNLPMLAEGQYVVRELREVTEDETVEQDMVFTINEKTYIGAEDGELVTLDDMQYQVDYTQTGDPETDEGIKVTVSNTRMVSWQIVKMSDSTNKEGELANIILAGAEFTLTGEDGNVYYGISQKGTGETEEGKGVIKWYTLPGANAEDEVATIPVGTYTLVETKAPAGYMLSTEEWTVTVGANVVTIQNREGETITGDSSTGVLTFTYFNTAVYELPSTGGVGVFWCAGAGFILLFAAILLIYKSKHEGILI